MEKKCVTYVVYYDDCNRDEFGEIRFARDYIERELEDSDYLDPGLFEIIKKTEKRIY